MALCKEIISPLCSYSHLSRGSLLPGGEHHLTWARRGYAWAGARKGFPWRRRWWRLIWLVRSLSGQTVSGCWLDGSLGGSLQWWLGGFIYQRLRELLRPLLGFFWVRPWLRLFCHTDKWNHMERMLSCVDIGCLSVTYPVCLICTWWWLGGAVKPSLLDNTSWRQWLVLFQV